MLMPRLLEAEFDRSTRQLATHMFRKLEALLRGCDQVAVAQQHRRAIVVPVLDPRADFDHIYVRRPLAEPSTETAANVNRLRPKRRA